MEAQFGRRIRVRLDGGNDQKRDGSHQAALPDGVLPSTSMGSAKSAERAPSGLPDVDVCDEERLWRRDAHVVNHFRGNVDAAHARFGVMLTASARRATGRITDDQVAAAHRGFVPPVPFAKALGVLHAEHVLLLTGDEAIGKVTSAIVLLHAALEDPGAPLASLSPALSLGDLVDYDYRAGHGYLITDRIGGVESTSMQRFALERVAARLRDRGAYLVLTSARNRVRLLDRFVVDWQPPDPLELFAKHSSEPLNAECAKRVADQRRPGTVIAFAAALPSGTDAAFALLDGSASRTVVRWFDEHRDRRDVLAVAALAFAHGLPERAFETTLARLFDLACLASEDVTSRSIGIRRGSNPLAAISTGKPESGHAVGERRVVFRSVEYRRRVIAELVRRFGYELWEPVRTWLRECAALRLSDSHYQVALGIALLAKVSPRETEEDLLRPLADGGLAERLTAAHSLSWMCIDESSAPYALNIAMNWSTQSGARRARTAALALGAELGLRYPSDAMRTLWLLATRNQQVSETARDALVLLFRAAVDNSENTEVMLSFLRVLARPEVEGGRDLSRARLAVTTLLDVLTSGFEVSGDPVAAYVLRHRAGTATVLGELWAWTLRSASHRGRSITALGETLRVLADSPGTEDTVRDLGVAIRSGISAEQRGLLRRDLRSALLGGPSASQRCHDLLRALLSALASPSQTA